MAALGVIGCTVLTNELAYLVARDRSAKTAVVVDNKEGRKLVGRLERSRACEDLDLVEVHHLGSRRYDDSELVIWMNPSELHDSQVKMRNAMTAEIKLMAESVDCILLLYGQCRCQTLDISGLEREIGVPILYLVDRNNTVVDDCISAIMGGSERYLSTMKQHKGAFFITPGYVEGHLLRTESKDIIELMEEIERMSEALEALGNPPLIKLDSGIGGEASYHDTISRFARTFDLEVLTLSCGMSVFEDSYDWARAVLRARTRHREPITVMSGGEALSTPPISEHIWEDLDR